MQAFKKVDMESWPRREHYRYYTEALKVEFNMTVPVDVQNLLRFCHAHGYKFYAAAIYCVTKALNRIENFRMFKNADGELCVWDKIVPNFTFFHPDDCTFSDCWTDFSEDFPTFYNCHYRRYADLQGCQGHQDQAEPACEFLLRILYAVDGVYRLRQPRRGRTACILPYRCHGQV